jgi:hypothetical protein
MPGESTAYGASHGFIAYLNDWADNYSLGPSRGSNDPGGAEFGAVQSFAPGAQKRLSRR